MVSIPPAFAFPQKIGSRKLFALRHLNPVLRRRTFFRGQVVSHERHVRQRSRCSCVLFVTGWPSSACWNPSVSLPSAMDSPSSPDDT